MLKILELIETLYEYYLDIGYADRNVTLETIPIIISL